MPPRRGIANGSIQRFRAIKCRLPVASLLVISVVTPLVFLAGRLGNFRSTFGHNEFPYGSANVVADQGTLNGLQQQKENLFSKEVMEAIKLDVEDSGPLNLNAIGSKHLSSSWVLDKPVDVTREELNTFQADSSSDKNEEKLPKNQDDEISERTAKSTLAEEVAVVIEERVNDVVKKVNLDTENQKKDEKSKGSLLVDHSEMDKSSPDQIPGHQMRIERKSKRLTELTQQDEAAAANLEKDAVERSKDIEGGSLNKYNILGQENYESSDSLVRLLRDQIIMAKAYASMAQARNHPHLLHDLRIRIKESQRVLGEANIDSDLPRSAPERIKSMRQMLIKAREQLYDCTAITKKLRAMLHSTEEQARVLKKQSTFLSQLAAKTVPKGLHCLSMRLTVEYNMIPEDQREFPGRENLENPRLFHYALFSDNVLAASVVVNSTVCNAKEPEKHVFHLVTDKLNYWPMKMWFLANPPGNATIHIQNIDDFKWLNTSYCPVLRQLESAAMKEYYFKAYHPTKLAAGSSNLKYRNPKYLSMLNHLRFYLPQVYPKLDKILFLDDDIVVQKDLTPLWSVNLRGKVNGAVETCGHSFHRFDKYLNFSNPRISRNFDPHACGWAYGMNVFDLREWKKQDITGIYHKWQNLNEDRVLWKLGTLPPGLITFYKLTHPLDKHWHVLGLGYNPSVGRSEIEGAAVVHYNGNMKPWLELAITKFKSYWTKYVKYDHFFLQQCNINP